MARGGGAQTAWADTEAITITDEAGFLGMTANGNYKLGADITVTTPYSKTFKGTFDGDGYTVKLKLFILFSGGAASGGIALL